MIPKKIQRTLERHAQDLQEDYLYTRDPERIAEINNQVAELAATEERFGQWLAD